VSVYEAVSCGFQLPWQNCGCNLKQLQFHLRKILNKCTKCGIYVYYVSYVTSAQPKTSPILTVHPVVTVINIQETRAHCEAGGRGAPRSGRSALPELL
jgi:hypothetical protein